MTHGARDYGRGKAHMNSIEGYWSHFKRSVRGTHIHISAKHMHLYLAEFDFRHNARKIPDRMFYLLTRMLHQERPV